jgi:hypothetical protein
MRGSLNEAMQTHGVSFRESLEERLGFAILSLEDEGSKQD